MARENLFEMGANFDDGWSSNNKTKDKTVKKGGVLPPNEHQLHFAKEKRKGKTVTIVKPFALEKNELQTVLKTVKKRLGVGGTQKEDTLEFQGEIQEKLRTQLSALDFNFK